MSRLITGVLLIFMPVTLFCQYDFPSPGDVFDDSTVARIDIEIEEVFLGFILNPNNEDSNSEYPATFYYTRDGIVDTVENVGFRLRGNTSRAAGKKSFKVSFNANEKGKRYKGLEKLNLNGEHNDPSVMRSKICWDLYSKVGIPSSRSNHVELYINEEYKGLYLNVEHIDERFLKKRFKGNDGNLYKCLWPADLLYLGDNQELYKSYMGGRRTYDLKTNQENEDYSNLVHFIDVLNNYEGDDFKCELEQIFDVENYLKVIVMDILVSNWDGPIVNKNNFYLYDDPITGKFTYIPFDLDNTMGISWGGTQWVDSDIYDWSNSWGQAERPIYEKIMAIKEYRDKVSYYFQQYSGTFFNFDYMEPYLTEFKDKLSPFRENDTYASLDYGWSFEAFIKSFNEGLGTPANIGLTQYIDARNASVFQQLDLDDPLPTLDYYKAEWASDRIKYSIKVNFPWLVIGQVILNFQVNDEEWQSLEMTSVDESLYEILIENPGVGEMKYFFEVTNFAGARRWPFCADEFIPLALETSGHLVINEFLASNNTGEVDEANEFEDWIELYNPVESELLLSQYYLTDDPADPGKWQLNGSTILPGHYVNVWADDDKEQGENHANFKLSKGGEFIGLYFLKDNVYFPIDTLSFGPQESDKSYGRLPNGTGDFQILDIPSFGYNNEEASSTSELKLLTNITVYPNPASEQISIDINSIVSGPIEIEIFNITGKIVWKKSQEFNDEISIDLNEIGTAKGSYIIKIQNAQGSLGVNKFVRI